MHVSEANVITASFGARTPTSPSLEPNTLTIGAPKPSAITRRRSGRNVSLVVVTINGEQVSSPLDRATASRANMLG